MCENIYLPALKLVLLQSRSIFGTLEVILRQLEVELPLKCLINGIEIGILVIAVLFLEHWRLYCVNCGTVAKIGRKS